MRVAGGQESQDDQPADDLIRRALQDQRHLLETGGGCIRRLKACILTGCPRLGATLLAHFDEARVRSLLPHEKIETRPVFHYRLPQAHLSDPAWSIMPDWERWLTVELLARNPEELAALGRAALGRGIA